MSTKRELLVDAIVDAVLAHPDASRKLGKDHESLRIVVARKMGVRYRVPRERGVLYLYL